MDLTDGEKQIINELRTLNNQIGHLTQILAVTMPYVIQTSPLAHEDSSLAMDAADFIEKHVNLSRAVLDECKLHRKK